MASSSDAADLLAYHACLRRQPCRRVTEIHLLGWRVGWRIATRSFCVENHHQKVVPCELAEACGIASRVHGNQSLLTFPDLLSTYLQHVQQGRLSGIIETEEEEFGVLVQESQGRKSIPDWTKIIVSSQSRPTVPGQLKLWAKVTYTS